MMGRSLEASWGSWVGVGLAIVAMIAGLAWGDAIPLGKAAPEIANGAWINSEPLTLRALRGRVVLVDFWTYG